MVPFLSKELWILGELGNTPPESSGKLVSDPGWLVENWSRVIGKTMSQCHFCISQHMGSWMILKDSLSTLWQVLFYILTTLLIRSTGIPNHLTIQQLVLHFMVLVSKQVGKVGDLSWGWPEGSLFNSYYTEERVLLHSLDCTTLPLILTL